MGHISASEFRRLLALHANFRPEVYIETGLWRGKQLGLAATVFRTCHGIELDKHWHRQSTDHVRRMPHVRVHRGDSAILLPRLLLEYANRPCFVKLDAHFCATDPPVTPSAFPLWAELRAIASRKVRDIICVDDVHTFGVARPELRFSEGDSEWEAVSPDALAVAMGGRIVDSVVTCDGMVFFREPCQAVSSDS